MEFRLGLLPAEALTGDPIINVQGVAQRFGRRTIFRDVSFAVHRGEVFVILGGSGCGKSTLMKQLIGLLRPSAGRIQIFDRTITGPQGDAALRDVQRRMGVMFQSGALFGSMNLLENVMLAMEMFTDLPPDAREVVARMKAWTGRPERRCAADARGNLRRHGSPRRHRASHGARSATAAPR